MNPLIGSSLIEGGASLLGIAGSAVANSKAVRDYNKGQMELAKYQNDRNLEMWNLQNEYNSPSAQMQRFKEAGLNPNLIYSQGSAGNASGIPETQIPQYQMDNSTSAAIRSVGNLAGDMIGKMFQYKQMAKQIEKTDAEINQTKAITQKLNTEIPFLDRYFSSRNENMDWQNNMLYAGFKNALAGNVRADENHKMQMKINEEQYDFNKLWHKFQLEEGKKESYRNDVRVSQLWKQIQIAASRLSLDQAQFEFSKMQQKELFPYQLDMMQGNALNSLARGLTTAKLYDFISNPDSWKNISLKTKFGDATLGQILNGLSSLSSFMGGYHKHILEP